MSKRYFRYDPNSDSVVEVERTIRQHLPRYPLAVEALAVHPDQIGEARDHARAHGVPIEFRGDGSPLVEDAGHYKRYRKLMGVHHRNGFES